MNVFIILKAHFVQKTASDEPSGCSIKFFINARNVVTLIRKAINLCLSLDNYFHQIDSVPFKLISLKDLTTESNYSSRNAS